MASDGKILARALDALNERKHRREQMYQARRADVFARSPAARELDAQIRALPARALRASLEEGEAAAETVTLLKQQSFLLRGELAQELVLMGLPFDWLEEDYFCPKCRDTGYVEGRMCSCLQELVRQEQTRELSSLLDMGNETFQNFRLDLYDDSVIPVLKRSPRGVMRDIIYPACRAFAADFGAEPANLLMTGGTGLGKTFLSTCIAREVTEKGFSVVYTSSAACFLRFEDEKFSRDDDSASEDVERYLSCDLLILDDLGTEMTTSFTVSALYRLINTRLVRRKSTIINTNLSFDELESRYSAAIASRLTGEYRPLFFVGRDIRTRDENEA